jgi:O-antigen ligase
MSTLATPSAKAHERVTGRWPQDIMVESRKDWLVYYTKAIVGTPVPWLMLAFVVLTFVTRAGLELSAWGIGLLSSLYIGADRLSTPREFRFFRVGSVFFLLGYALTTLITALTANSFAAGLETIGGARWVLLIFLFAYTWELFPGLNRAFYLMIGTAVATSLYGFWQHFTGVDLVTGAALANAPTGELAYFMITGFFPTPEVFGTLLAVVLPFPAASFLLSAKEKNTDEWLHWGSLAIVLVLGLAVFWTYRPGLWLAAIGGVLITLIMQGRRQLVLLGSMAALLSVVMLVSYKSTDQLFADLQKAELTAAERQRAQINTQVALWQESPVFGVGSRATEAANYDPGTGNVYFQILAQSGLIGGLLYLLFILGFLLSTYRIFREVPPTHHWHRVFISGALASQVAFHIAGLYWSTVTEAHAMYLFVFLIGSVNYLSEHYGRGLVPDDFAL